MTQMIFTLSADKMVTLRALSAASMGSTVSVQLRGSASVARVAFHPRIAYGTVSRRRGECVPGDLLDHPWKQVAMRRLGREGLRATR